MLPAYPCTGPDSVPFPVDSASIPGPCPFPEVRLANARPVEYSSRQRSLPRHPSHVDTGEHGTGQPPHQLAYRQLRVGGGAGVNQKSADRGPERSG